MAIVNRFFDEEVGQICSKFWELIQVVTPDSPEANSENNKIKHVSFYLMKWTLKNNFIITLEAIG
jgi:hypothetical protein